MVTDDSKSTSSVRLRQGYGGTQGQVRDARLTAQRRVDTEVIRLYWEIGSTILHRQEREGLGAR
jgi:hypothetical protein